MAHQRKLLVKFRVGTIGDTKNNAKYIPDTMKIYEAEETFKTVSILSNTTVHLDHVTNLFEKLLQHVLVGLGYQVLHELLQGLVLRSKVHQTLHCDYPFRQTVQLF